MSYYHKACEDCVMEWCLLKQNGDVESCDIIEEYERDKRKKEVK